MNLTFAPRVAQGGAPLALDRDLLRVSGPDAHAFLQGLVTQDVERLAHERAIYAALLSPQGKVICDMFLWAERDGVLIDVDRMRADDLKRRLSLYTLRAHVSIEGASEGVFAGEAPFEGAVADPRLAVLGWRGLAPARAAGSGEAALRARMLGAGVPDLARDAGPEEVFGLEALLEELNGVDFKKGCFVGQENVSRMKRRATTRRKFCPISFDGPAPPPGASVRAGEIEVGTVRSSAPGRALALLRLDRALGAPGLSVDGRPARLSPPPWLILPQRELDGAT